MNLFDLITPAAPPIEAGAATAVTFDGPDLTAADHARLGEQLEAVKRLMSDGAWRTPEELEAATGYRWASINARLRDCRKDKFGGHTVEKQRVPGARGLFRYRLILKGA